MIKKRLALFISGAGSNALNIIDYFQNHSQIEVGFVLSNNENSPAIAASKSKSIDVFVCSNNEVLDGKYLIDLCQDHAIDYIILAGYLKLIPGEFIQRYSGRIINVHPSLLPKYGGKGMYGENVHNAVLAANETESGISIHLVNEKFDEGRLLAQFHCLLSNVDSLTTLKKKIAYLEHSYFPAVIEKTILSENYV